jgi:hypothetical protein
MPSVVTERPRATDHAPYYSRYIDLVPAGNLVAIMSNQVSLLCGSLRSLADDVAGRSYAPGKWTIKEVVGHLIDTERVFSYRAAAFSRSDPASLPSFDQTLWIRNGAYQQRALDDILSEWSAARAASVSLLACMPEEGLNRIGVASGVSFTALSAITVLPGHVIYHLQQLERMYQVPTGQHDA